MILHQPRSSRRQGVALVIVLGFLVLISALVISFFSSVSTELVSAKNAAAAVSTRQLAESATNLVISQVAEGTAGYKDPKNTSSDILAWASQPGMIRTYTDNGEPYRYYKLYSAQNMVLENLAGVNVTEREFRGKDVPASWVDNPGLFVDLNAPVKTQLGTYEYPIVNPKAQESALGANDGVAGFEIQPAPGFKGNGQGASGTRPPEKDSEANDPTVGPQANPAPMPVRWLYVLKNGTLSTASEPGAVGGPIELGDTEQSKPTKDNPVVGRIAFWTDDDTSKVNINTASEGVFWDRPWSQGTTVSTSLAFGNSVSNDASISEVRYAGAIPGQNEYQRYQGHPAMTCLSPVLGFKLPFRTAIEKGNYYMLVPRVLNEGTRAGSRQAPTDSPLVSDNERLFASVDELAFAPQFTGIRKTPSTLPSAEVSALLNKTRFFLTATSRAPEVNLFNRPRVSLWPLQASATARNTKDRLIAFCGTTGPSTARAPYYFQRANEYVLNGNKQFGDGRSGPMTTQPSSASISADFNIPRNQTLYRYLQSLSDKKIPGFGGTFIEKYGPDRDQIITSMMDYVRSNVNSYSTATNLTPQYDFAPTRRGGPVAGETQIVPMVPRGQTGSLAAGTKGYGRFATVSEAALVFFRQVRPDKKQFMHSFVVMEIFNPSPGLASWSPHVRYVVKGLEKFGYRGKAFNDSATDMQWAHSLNPPGAPLLYASNWVTSRVGYSGGGHTTPFMGLWSSFRYFNDGGSDLTKIPGVTNAEREYPFYTRPVEIPNPTGGTFGFSGGRVTIEIYSGFENLKGGFMPDQKNLVQTLEMDFPSIDPARQLPLPGDAGNVTFATRLAAGSGGLIDTGKDVVRSVEVSNTGPIGGDLRLICGMATVPAGPIGVEPDFTKAAFKPHRYYSDPTKRMAHSLRSEEGQYGGDAGDTSFTKLDTTVATNRVPAAAHGLAKAQLRFNLVELPGDWDNMTGNGEDGAYINKSDEGNQATGGNGGYFDRGSFNVESGVTYSPNRQISSAVTFGSLPTGVRETYDALLNTGGRVGRPWQTLLFNPHPLSRGQSISFAAQSTTKHPGFGTVGQGGDPSRHEPPYIVPPDHLWLDLFTMPVVEPYAISEPLSTAGKINLNYQLAPFTYIKRATGVQAVLRSTRMMMIPTNSGDKSTATRFDINSDVGSTGPGGPWKLDVAQEGTLFGFQDKFERGEIFRSASEICDISMVPTGGTLANARYQTMASTWATYKRTGDNVREGVYGHIYPRVTTKSNSFTVHMRVQALRKSVNSDAAVWDENKDQVLSEYRGSASIERYIDPADPTLPDFAANPSVADNLDRHYRFRVVSTKAFTP